MGDRVYINPDDDGGGRVDEEARENMRLIERVKEECGERLEDGADRVACCACGGSMATAKDTRYECLDCYNHVLCVDCFADRHRRAETGCRAPLFVQESAQRWATKRALISKAQSPSTSCRTFLLDAFAAWARRPFLGVRRTAEIAWEWTTFAEAQ
jgi:DNA primase large subunit